MGWSKRGVVEAVEVDVWLDVADVFSVQADDDPAWAVLTFKPGCGPRSLIVRGEAEAVAGLISAERRGSAATEGVRKGARFRLNAA